MLNAILFLMSMVFLLSAFQSIDNSDYSTALVNCLFGFTALTALIKKPKQEK